MGRCKGSEANLDVLSDVLAGRPRINGDKPDGATGSSRRKADLFLRILREPILKLQQRRAAVRSRLIAVLDTSFTLALYS